MTANRGCGWFPETGDQMTFRTPNLLLEPMAEKHLGFVQAEVSKWEVAQRLSSVPHPYPDDGAADYLKRVQAHVEIREQISWVVADRATGTDLGVITLRFFDVDNQPCWELGYWFAPSAWGRGVATEAAFHVLTFAFRFMEVETVTSGVFLDNPASRRVLEKAGFEGWTQDSIDTAHSGRQPHLATRMTRAEFEEFLFSGGCTAQPQLERSVPVVWVAAAALFDSTDRVLVAQRPAGKSLAGLWEFPGGKIEALESPETALIRELKEELGIDVGEGCLAPLTFASHAYPTFHLMMPLYAINKWQGEPKGQEGQALQWVTKAELRALPMPPADAPLLPAVLDWM